MNEEYTYIKAYFIDGSDLIIPEGRVVAGTDIDVLIEEIGGKSFLIVKANIKYLFIGDPK
jgi:hypothetical protein